MSHEMNFEVQQQIAMQQLMSLYGVGHSIASIIWVSYPPEYGYGSLGQQKTQFWYAAFMAFFGLMSVIFADPKDYHFFVLLIAVDYVVNVMRFFNYRITNNRVARVLHNQSKATDVSNFNYKLVNDPANAELLTQIFRYRYQHPNTVYTVGRIIAFVVVAGLLFVTVDTMPLLVVASYALSHVTYLLMQHIMLRNIGTLLSTMQDSHQNRDQVHNPSCYHSRWIYGLITPNSPGVFLYKN